MKSLTRLLITPILLIVLAGCAVPAAAPAQSTTTPANAAAAANFPVTITHDRGEITLEKPAERIIVFSEEFTELFIALDLAPVGVGLWRNEPTGDVFTQLPYLDQPIPGQPRYINGSEPNLEVIAQLRPDLILNHEYSDSGNADLQAALAQIAPVLTYSGGEVGGWKRALRGLGQATGYSERAETIIAEYDAQVAEFQAAMTPVVAQAPNVTVLLSTVDTVGVFDQRFAIGGLLEVLGFSLSVPESVEMPASGFTNISVETLSEITADTIIQLRFDDDQVHISDPILDSLPMPTLRSPIYPGMGYTGPLAETIYLQNFTDAFRAQYLADSE
jgi:ABC-type Fe3+-hydroxamate transport system substrate-binding protein